MRRLVMWNLVTLDGFFEGARSWDLGWHELVWDEELEQFVMEQIQSIGVLVFGRVTYEGMAAYWSNARGRIADFMNSVPKVVFSRTLSKAEWNNTQLVGADAPPEITRLKHEAGKDLYIFGSAGLSRALMHNGLIDEYRLCITPLVLGTGNPLFKPGTARMQMKLLETRPLKSGSIIVRYQPLGDQRP